ncbi:hypothetical protein [Aquimonas sp.]|jgi:hypothetical protein|uniref:hypothetical protein n=1 Tax=Aquimonas sp. TaxID=1872588 RepID=UPI0037C0532E
MAISTASKDKLRPGWAYAASLSSLSKGLESVQGLTRLPVFFSRHPGVLDGAFESTIKESELYPLIRAAFVNHQIGISSSQSLIEEGWYGERRELHVFGIPSDLRAMAGDLLKSDQLGFATVAQWLAAPRTDTWKSGLHYLWISVDASGKSLAYVESEGRDGWRWTPSNYAFKRTAGKDFSAQ